MSLLNRQGAQKVPDDIERIVNLTRRKGEAPDFTPYLKTPHGSMTLRPIQNEMLWQASVAKGLLGLVGVGEGKTLTSFLLPRVLKSERPLLLIPASMRAQAQADWGNYAEHFNLPQHMEMRSYEEISTRPGLLKSLDPDLIICDEVHKLKNPSSTRTRRLSKYFKYCARLKKPLPAFIGLSGSITSTSIKDFWHLSLWALKENTPLPLKWNFMNEWALALDKSKTHTGKKDMSLLVPLMVHFKTTSGRLAFKKNLLSAQGVVISHKAPPPCDLEINTFKTPISKKAVEMMKNLSETWQTPQGEELDSALAIVRLRRQMICGFYYYWKWETEPDTEWLMARSAWAKSCRLFCSKAPEGLDTPALLERALILYLNKQLDAKFPKELVLAYVKWLGQKSKPLPPVGVQWFSRYFVDAVIAWANAQTEPPLIWYEHTALANAIARLTGWPVYGTGKESDEALTRVTTPHIALVSIRAHSQGKNLQVWGNHFIAHPLSDGARWEQLLGRSHRHGQKRDVVTVTTPNFSEFQKAIASAKESAEYIEQSTGLKQRLLTATWKPHKLDLPPKIQQLTLQEAKKSDEEDKNT